MKHIDYYLRLLGARWKNRKAGGSLEFKQDMPGHAQVAIVDNYIERECTLCGYWFPNDRRHECAVQRIHGACLKCNRIHEPNSEFFPECRDRYS